MRRYATVLAPALLSMCALITLPSFGQTTTPTPQAAPGYTLSVFASAPSGLSAPDSIAVLGDRVFIGYGDNHAPDGSDGLAARWWNIAWTEVS